MLIVQITDSHIERPGVASYGRNDTRAALTRALDAVKKIAPRPDLILHTGDITHHGDAQAYREVRAAIDATGIPHAALTGNHDETDALRDGYAGAAWMPPPGPFLHYVLEDLPVRIVCLDTTIPKEPGGTMCAARLDWLAAQLAAGGARPTLIAMHHPAFRIGRTVSDARPFGNADKFSKLLSGYPNVSLVIAGHVHCVLQARVGAAVAIAAPSTSYQFSMDRTPGAPLAFMDEPPGLYVHDWTADAGFTSQYQPIGDFAGPFPVPLPKRS
jgi:3',5'-cyclic AMP phosphodiesterase CpdA